MSRSGFPGVERRAASARRRTRHPGCIPGLVPVGRHARGADADRRRGTASRSTTAPRAFPVSSPGSASEPAQLRLASPVVAVRGDRVVLRGETTLGGAVVLDPAPPRRLEAGAARVARGGRPGVDHRGDRLRSRLGRVARGERSPVAVRARSGARYRRAGRRLGIRAGVARGDERRDRRPPACSRRGVSPRAGARDRRAPAGRALGGRQSSRCSRSTVGVARRISRASSGRSAQGGRQPPSSSVSSAKPAWPPSRSTTASWRASSRPRAGWSGSATDSSSRPLHTKALGGSSSRSVVPRARSPSPAFATWRESDGGTRSSCSNDSIRTASRDASATAGCCGGRGH